MPTPDNLPIYWATLDEGAHGISFVSLVDAPAIERNFVALAAVKRAPVCAVANEEKRLVYGPLMRADYPIYRNSPDMGEYYVAFSADVIRQAVEKFFADKQASNVNIMHAPGSQVDGVRLVQLFIKNKAAGLDPAGFEDVEDGSLFGEYHVTDDEVWNAIKAGEFRGFSIEGNFSLNIQAQQVKQKSAAMSKLKKIKAQLAKMLASFGEVTTDKGAIFWDDDDDLKAGMPVYVEDENGERKPAPDGDYKTEDGKTIKVAGGKVAEIVDPDAEVGAKAQGEGGEGGDGADAGKSGDAGAKTDGEGGDDTHKRLEAVEKHLADIDKTLEKIVETLEKTNVQLRAVQKTPAAQSAQQEFAKTGDPTGDRIAAMLKD